MFEVIAVSVMFTSEGMKLIVYQMSGEGLKLSGLNIQCEIHNYLNKSTSFWHFSSVCKHNRFKIMQLRFEREFTWFNKSVELITDFFYNNGKHLETAKKPSCNEISK